jgi:hypothetical protein
MRDRVLNWGGRQTNIRICERRSCVLSGRRHDRKRASRVGRQVNVCAEAKLIGRLIGTPENAVAKGSRRAAGRVALANRLFAGAGGPGLLSLAAFRNHMVLSCVKT